jgi:hypothetical protein
MRIAIPEALQMRERVIGSAKGGIEDVLLASEKSVLEFRSEAPRVDEPVATTRIPGLIRRGVRKEARSRSTEALLPWDAGSY